MKKYITKLGLWAVVLTSGVSLSSCDSLNLAPEDYFAEGNFWQNEAQVNAYMIGTHERFRQRAAALSWLGEGRAKILVESSSGTMGVTINNSNIINSQLTQSSPGYDDWANFYTNIFDCNLLIERVNAMNDKQISTAAKTKILAQAHGLRAFCYFTLLRSFGGVPLVDKPNVLTETDINKLYTARATADQTMAFIKEDIKKSEEYYATDDFSVDPGRCFWSKGATVTLKGDAYLWAAKAGRTSYDVADLNTALAALQSLPGSKYGLMDKFLDVFTYPNKGNKEIVFAINSNVNQAYKGGYYDNMLYAAAGWGGWQKRDGTYIEGDTLNLLGAGIQRLEYKWELFAAYENEDVRKRTNFFDFYDCRDKDGTLNPIDPITGLPEITAKTFVQRKYLGTVNDGGNRVLSDDQIVYRYADVLLMMAEIKNALDQDPSAEINQIRERAYRTPAGALKPYPIYANGDFTQNELAIYLERVKEMIMEGKAWYDLLRMQYTKGGDRLVFVKEANIDGKKPVLNKATEAYKVVWPIGNSVRSNDKLVEQNPGYAQF